MEIRIHSGQWELEIHLKKIKIRRFQIVGCCLSFLVGFSSQVFIVIFYQLKRIGEISFWSIINLSSSSFFFFFLIGMKSIRFLLNLYIVSTISVCNIFCSGKFYLKKKMYFLISNGLCKRIHSEFIYIKMIYMYMCYSYI